MTWPGRYVYVCAIEGVDTLLTNATDASAVVTAWGGTDWTSATPGLFVDLDQQQTGHPWEPFQGGGKLTLSIADNNIGILTHRTAGGAETELTVSLDQDDTTITVQDTSQFVSSGVAHIGTECIAYAGKTSTMLTGCTRGKFSPFGTGTGSSRYAHNHRIGIVGGYSPSIAPKVTQYPRTWIGRWVGLWVHGYDSDGALQTKAQAQRVFAGRLVEVRDDADLLSTVLVAEHVLTDLKDATIAREMFAGEIADGIYLPSYNSSVKFTFRDFNGASWRNANALVVVPSGATGANQLNEGFYSHEELFGVLTSWFASERQANRLWGTYQIYIAPEPNVDGATRTKIRWKIAGITNVRFEFEMRKVVAMFLGFHDIADPQGALGGVTIKDSGDPGDQEFRVGDHPPLRAWVSNGLSTAFLRVQNVSGRFQDQKTSLPASCAIPPSATGEWGIFRFNDETLIRAKFIDNLDGTYNLSSVEVVLEEVQGPYSSPPLGTYAKTIEDLTPTTVKQVFIFEMRTDAFLNRLVYSGGTTNYNHGTYDNLPYGCGLSYPGELFGTTWETSIANMPGADKLIAPIIDKPIKVSTLIGSDLLLRHLFPVWKSGGLRMATWQTPTLSLAIASLTEDNKAEPSGRNVNHRSPTLLSDRWAKNIIKIEFNRDGIGGEFTGTINIEDRTAIDDIGDRGEPFTIEARNTYTQFAQTGAGIEDIVPNVFIPAVQLFTKPVRTLRRSIDLTLWDLAPGDIISVSDSFARDPTTGIRRLSSRPGIVVSHKYNPGGATPGGTTAPIVGEVELMFIETNRIYAYSPSALIDHTATVGSFAAGYDDTNRGIRTVPNAYSEASEPIDAANFAADDGIIIHEIDPANPALALSWFTAISYVDETDIYFYDQLVGFDASKRYRVIPAQWSWVQGSQQDKAFQADDADGLVENGAQAYQFGLVTSTVNATVTQHTDLPERHVDLTYGDGKPYDVGSIVGFSRLVENLIDHKTAIQSPYLSNTVMSNTTSPVEGVTWKLVMMAPVYMSAGLLSNTLVRYLKLAPWFRSSTGTSASVRVSLCATPPVANAVFDIDRGTYFGDATWSTSSTTWSKPAAASIACNLKDGVGIAWLLVECTYGCETRGVAECTEQERFEV